jgi:hypothetical protein
MPYNRLTGLQSAVCKAIGFAFALAALLRSAMIMAAGAAPDLLAVSINCKKLGCTMETTPLDLLPARLQVATTVAPDATAVLAEHMRQAAVRQDLMVGQLVIDLPMIGLLASVAWGIFVLGQSRGSALGRAIPWLRQGAVFALIAVVTTPFGQAVQTKALARAFESNPGYALDVNVEHVALNLMLALVALAVTWALSAGIRAERDLAEIV